MRATIEVVGAPVRYLPPYSPDLNPIEQAFAKLKAYLRAARPRSFDDVCALMRDAILGTPRPNAAATCSTPGIAFLRGCEQRSRRGNGSKTAAIGDGRDLPLAIYVASASADEVRSSTPPRHRSSKRFPHD